MVSKRRDLAEQALNVIGWEFRTPLASEPKSFEQVFDLLHALAAGCCGCSERCKGACHSAVGSPMGEGKTEAALFAHLDLQRRFGHRGLYVALPTKATGNAMFKRTLKFLRSQGTDRKLDLQLLHGAKLLNDTFRICASQVFTIPQLAGVSAPGNGLRAKSGRFSRNMVWVR